MFNSGLTLLRRRIPLKFACFFVGLSFLSPAPELPAGEFTGTKQSSRLYTRSDPAASGGIYAKMALTAKPIQQAFAIDSGNPKLVYQGAVSKDGKEIRFTGLPTAIYDLMLVTRDSFYEGCRLARDPDTLTDRDRQAIAFMVNKSVPFFDTKKIHRCEGTTGRSGKARCVLQEARTLPITLQDHTTRTDIQVRSLKLAFLEDVGDTGWQLVMTREILRTEVDPGDVKGLLLHYYFPVLGGIRVVDTEKDLGEINLRQGASISKQ
ncbi:MAG: hypothetical protein PHW60_05015 [Kiritimatiellae bacterium]|nr:hypothetical protein [Kiritimatiellia bacterium]